MSWRVAPVLQQTIDRIQVIILTAELIKSKQEMLATPNQYDVEEVKDYSDQIIRSSTEIVDLIRPYMKR